MWGLSAGSVVVRPICATCNLFFQPDKNGVYFEEGRPVCTGTVDPEDVEWVPYKLWVGDRWRCRGCNATIIVGVASQPLAEHYQPDYEGLKQRLGCTLRIDDC